MIAKRSTFLVSIVLVAGCAAPAQQPAVTPIVAPSTGSSASSTIAPVATAANATAPNSEPPSLPSGPTFRPDIYPSWLVGKLYALHDPVSRAVSLARVGLPGRIPLQAGSVVLGSFGDRIVTSQPGDQKNVIRILSFRSGGEVASFVIAGSGSGVPYADGVVTDDLHVIGTDGSIRQLHDPGPTPHVDVPVRVVAISESGRRLATSMCEAGIEDAYNCRPTSIIDIATGALVDTIDAGPMPVARFTGRWLLTRSFASVAAVDADGHALWSAADLSKSRAEQVAIWRLEILGGRIVAIAEGVDDSQVALVRIDPLTGAHRVLFRYEYGQDWRFWPGWSSDGFAVLGHDDDALNGVAGLACDPCSEAIDAAVVNLETGAFGPRFDPHQPVPMTDRVAIAL